MPGPLAGLKIIEIAGIGPGPFCAMMLADMGAEVIRVDRSQNVMGGDPSSPPADVLNRGRRSIGVDLKNPDGDELILGPRRDKPACSPIALFGACGQSFHTRRPFVVTDVNNLRAGYIACDPRDRSEVVIPCMDSYDSDCWSVLDADSHDTHSFTDADVHGLTKVLIHMKLHVPQSGTIDRV